MNTRYAKLLIELGQIKKMEYLCFDLKRSVVEYYEREIESLKLSMEDNNAENA